MSPFRYSELHLPAPSAPMKWARVSSHSPPVVWLKGHLKSLISSQLLRRSQVISKPLGAPLLPSSKEDLKTPLPLWAQQETLMLGNIISVLHCPQSSKFGFLFSLSLLQI